MILINGIKWQMKVNHFNCIPLSFVDLVRVGGRGSSLEQTSSKFSQARSEQKTSPSDPHKGSGNQNIRATNIFHFIVFVRFWFMFILTLNCSAVPTETLLDTNPSWIKVKLQDES